MSRIYRSGFTIVELLIVIVVIAILAAIVIVGYNGISQRAIESSMQTDLRNAAGKLGEYRATNGEYPASLSAANGGRGLTASGSNQFTYTNTGSDYCVSITNTKTSNTYRMSGSAGAIESGSCAASCPASPPRWTPRSDYVTGDCVVVGSTTYRATSDRSAFGPRFIQAAGGYWNGSQGADFDWTWPSQARAGDLVLVAIWSGANISCTPTNTVSVGGTTYTPLSEHLRTANNCYRGQLYLVPYSASNLLRVDTNQHVVISGIVLRDTTPGDISIGRKTTADTLSTGVWDTAAQSLTYNGMILTVGLPRISPSSSAHRTWTAQRDAVQLDSFFTGWADYENSASVFTINTVPSEPRSAAVWTLFVTQPAFNTTGWAQQ